MTDNSGTAPVGNLAEALQAIVLFGSGKQLTQRIAALEVAVGGKDTASVTSLLTNERVDNELIRAAFAVKEAAGQVNVVIHAVGILLSLPHILEEGEVVESVSLGAGNTGRDYDLTTNLRIAEFKFIRWRGGAESIRQNQLFKDLVALLGDHSDRRKNLFVTGIEHPLRFLHNSRSLKSVLSKDRATADRFYSSYGDKYSRVNEFWQDVESRIEIIDLEERVPGLKFLETSEVFD